MSSAAARAIIMSPRAAPGIATAVAPRVAGPATRADGRVGAALATNANFAPGARPSARGARWWREATTGGLRAAAANRDRYDVHGRDERCHRPLSLPERCAPLCVGANVGIEFIEIQISTAQAKFRPAVDEPPANPKIADEWLAGLFLGGTTNRRLTSAS